MKYSRIFKFSLFIYLINVALPALLTSSFIEIFESEPRFFNSALYIVTFIFSLFIYICLARIQFEKPYIHAICVALIFWLLVIAEGLLLDNFFGITFNLLIYLFPFLLTVIAVSVGTIIGIKLKERQMNSLTET